ncbi:hypothetical protein DEJ36_12685 [Curtobacterium sp. MCPF17_052]|nr:hypothetical protein [Curtobacterium sp. MCPF17_052]WIB11746.1 hypothetical protein DEJ36_12685 [Curtobacterium sp. MCPF17_052]
MVVAHLGPPHPGFDWTRPESWSAVVDGRSAVLFALCAGVSLTLMTRSRPEGAPGAADLVVHRRRVLVRAVALFVLGSLLIALNTPVQVILPTYAGCFVATIPLLRARTRTVAAIAATALVIGPVCTAIGRSLLHDADDPIVHGVLLGAYPGIPWWGVVLVGLLVGRLPPATNPAASGPPRGRHHRRGRRLRRRGPRPGSPGTPARHREPERVGVRRVGRRERAGIRYDVRCRGGRRPPGCRTAPRPEGRWDTRAPWHRLGRAHLRAAARRVHTRGARGARGSGGGPRAQPRRCASRRCPPRSGPCRRGTRPDRLRRAHRRPRRARRGRR